jgi:uncharacterized cysteine cluster protein YcgN (CxxCxxCC family)
MNEEEWESLCDRCGKCCVLKIEDVDTGDIYYTDVACKLLDCGNATCMNLRREKTDGPGLCFTDTGKSVIAEMDAPQLHISPVV